MIHTDISYPDDLPIPLRRGYGVKHVSPLMRTDMESGRSRQRRKFTSVPSMVSVVWIFRNDAHAAAFEAWVRDALLDGAEWFNMPLKTPVGLQEYVCRFTDDLYDGPDLTGISGWEITARLEMFERPLMPPGWGLMPDFLINASLFDIAMNKKWPEANE